MSAEKTENILRARNENRLGTRWKASLPGVERFGRAIGLRVPFWKGRQVELWYCPRGTRVTEHYHEGIDSFIVYLLGTMRVTVEDKARTIFGPFRRRESNGRWIVATRYIPARQRHSAEVIGRFALFLNFERCHHRRSSASKDFVLVPQVNADERG